MSDLRAKILSNEIDINNSENFMSKVIKGFVYDVGKYIKVRGKIVPTYILTTGDDIMYLQLKDRDYSIEPCSISGETYPYGEIPRCIIQPNGISIETDQVSSPYARGEFQIEYNNVIRGFNAEFRRMPLKFTFDVKYVLDSFTDALEVSQQAISNFVFIKNYNISYLGQTIACSYKVPESFDTEKNIVFDDSETEPKVKTISLSIECSTNFPVYDNRTAIENDKFIRTLVTNVTTDTGDISTRYVPN